MKLTSITLLSLNIKNGTCRKYYFSKKIIKFFIISLILICFCQTIFFLDYYKNKMEFIKLKLINEDFIKKNDVLCNSINKSKNKISNINNKIITCLIDNRIFKKNSMNNKTDFNLNGKGGIELAFNINSDSNLLNKYLNKTVWINQEQWNKHNVYKEDILNLINFLGKRDISSNLIPSVWPLIGYITSDFGYRISPFTGKITFHKGLDIAQELGMPVKVTADGIVLFSGWDRDYGKVVIVKHGYGFQTLYAHNSFLLVKEGQPVKRNEVISLLGNTGMSTAPHLHYEVHVNGEAKNPLLFILE